MAGLGISAELGGSAIQRLSIALKEARGEGGPAIEQLAISAGFTTRAFEALVDSNPADAVVALAEAGADTDQVLNALNLSSVRVRSVFASLSKNSTTLTKAMNLANKAYVENTVLSKQAAAQAKSLSNAMKKLEAANVAVKDSIGKGASDAARVYFGELTKISKAFGGLLDDTNAQYDGIKKLGQVTEQWLMNFSFGVVDVTEKLGELINSMGEVNGEAEGLDRGASLFPVANLIKYIAFSSELLDLQNKIEDGDFIDPKFQERIDKSIKKLKGIAVLREKLVARQQEERRLAVQALQDQEKKTKEFEKQEKILNKQFFALKRLDDGIRNQVKLLKQDIVEGESTGFNRDVLEEAHRFTNALDEIGQARDEAVRAATAEGASRDQINAIHDAFDIQTKLQTDLNKQRLEGIKKERDLKLASLKEELLDARTELAEFNAEQNEQDITGGTAGTVDSVAEAAVLLANLQVQNKRDEAESAKDQVEDNKRHTALLKAEEDALKELKLQTDQLKKRPNVFG